jgi:hypothetical protein
MIYSVVAELSKHIRTRTKNINRTHNELRDLSSFFPSFLWLVRDFTLELTSEKGEQLSADDYLELALNVSILCMLLVIVTLCYIGI